jgi:hypothetical protein
MGELLIISVLIIPIVGLWIWMLVDCLTKEPAEGNERLIWLLVIVLVGFIGALLYLLIRRPQRKKAFGR